MYKTITNSWNFNDTKIKLLTRDDDTLVKKAKWYVRYESTPGHTLVNALFLGSGEYYSSNMNGDYFEEDELKKHHKSFLEGHHFKHHDNDDPAKKFGDIIDVFFNPLMHRVEGIIKVINSKSPEMVQRIEKGEPVPLSMACKVKYDVCSICGNKSHTTKDYCDHLKYHMCDILSDGRKVFAYNPSPKFFDISEVVVGADPTAFTLKKVANLKNNSKINIDKIALFDKLSLLERVADIEKRVFGMIQKKDPKVDILKKAYLNEKVPSNISIGTLANHGILYTPKDLNKQGSCTIYNDLLKFAGRDKILEKLDFEKDLYYNILDQNFVEKRSMLNKHFSNRILCNDSVTAKFCNKPLDKNSSIKLAALNLSILYNMDDINNLAIEASIVNNNL